MDVSKIQQQLKEPQNSKEMENNPVINLKFFSLKDNIEAKRRREYYRRKKVQREPILEMLRID